jgi:hypothetical protein
MPDKYRDLRKTYRCQAFNEFRWAFLILEMFNDEHEQFLVDVTEMLAHELASERLDLLVQYVLWGIVSNQIKLIHASGDAHH